METPVEKLLSDAIRQLEMSQHSLHNGHVIEGYEFIGGAILLLRNLHRAIESLSLQEAGRDGKG